MGCIQVKQGLICGPDAFVNLAPFGAKVWMSWHSYLGPTFYRSAGMVTPILVPSRKTWAAFGEWEKTTATVSAGE